MAFGKDNKNKVSRPYNPKHRIHTHINERQRYKHTIQSDNVKWRQLRMLRDFRIFIFNEKKNRRG